MNNAFRDRLQEMVATIDVVGLSDVRIGEMDSEPGWPDLQDSVDAAKTLLEKPDALAEDNIWLRGLLMSIIEQEEDVIELQFKVMNAKRELGL